MFISSNGVSGDGRIMGDNERGHERNNDGLFTVFKHGEHSEGMNIIWKGYGEGENGRKKKKKGRR